MLVPLLLGGRAWVWESAGLVFLFWIGPSVLLCSPPCLGLGFGIPLCSAFCTSPCCFSPMVGSTLWVKTIHISQTIT